MTEQASKNSGIKIALVVIPAVLIVSICVALYLGATADKEESQPVEGEITLPEMVDYLRKLNRVIGERRVDTPAGQKALRQVDAMTTGTLGPENLGYQVSRSQIDSANGLLWSTVWIDVGNGESSDLVVMAIPQAGPGSGPAFAYGFTEFLSAYEMKTAIRIVFYPPLVEGDLAEWIWKRCGTEGETLKAFVEVTGGEERDPETRILVPEKYEAFAEEMKSSKVWDDGIVIAPQPSTSLRVLLAGRAQGTREEHAQRLIRMMPVMKDLVERLGEVGEPSS